MKKLGTAFAGMLLLFLLCTAANAESAYVNVGSEMDRLKMRASPAADGEILGKYFHLVRVEVLEETGAWRKVRVGNRVGYMMARYLGGGDGHDFSQEAVMGWIQCPQNRGTLPLFESPSRSSAVLSDLPEQAVSVVATVGSDWVQVFIDRNGERVYGFLTSDSVTLTENFASVTVDTGDKESRLHLRSSPSADSVSLGLYYSGTECSCLFDNHDNGDAWTRVRIGDQAGYMLTEFLDDSSGGSRRYYTPRTRIQTEGAVLYDAANGNGTALSVLPEETRIEVLGLYGGRRYHVRIPTDTPYEFLYGFINISDVYPVSGAVSRQGALLCETWTYTESNGQIFPITEIGKAAAGSVVWIAGSYDPSAVSAPDSIDTGREYVLCDVEFPDTTMCGCLVPLSCLWYDEGLSQ